MTRPAPAADPATDATTEGGDAVLDARGLACPLPVLKAKKAIRSLPAGGVLTVLATDPGAGADFRAFCEHTGHVLVSHGEVDGVSTFRIRRKP